jgi:predicted amidohydrolase
MRITLTQLPSSRDRDRNLDAAVEVIEAAGAAGTDLILLPENCLFCGTNAEMRAAALSLESPEIKRLRDLARRWRTAIILGGFKRRSVDGTIHNTALVIDQEGALPGHYDKLHLFNAAVGGVVYQASSVETPGEGPVIVSLDGVRLGLTICYDVRFPELYRHLALGGAQVLLVPSAFTRATGEAHWEVLLRARAIENGAFVVASATIGGDLAAPPDPTHTHGHALCVDPWGHILADLGEAPVAWRTVKLDLDEVAAVRKRLPVLEHVTPKSMSEVRRVNLGPSGGS